MNTKYLSGNPISRLLIKHFLMALTSLVLPLKLSSQTILDVGCGEGMVTRQLRLLWPSALFHGLDVSPDLLKVARQLAPDIDYLSGSVYSLPYADRTYDLVYCTEVLEHLERPEKAISEIFRVGKAYFVFSVPNEPLWRIANIARGAYWPDLGNSPGHVNHWRKSEFIRLLSRYSNIIKLKTPFPWTIVLCRK